MRILTGVIARTAVAAAALSLLVSAAPTSASADEYTRDVGIGIGSGLASIIYAPAKLIYAGGGTLIAGLAYAASGGDRDVAAPIMNAAVMGDYVVTPAHLRREDSLEFVGRSPDHLRLEDELGHASTDLQSETF